MHINKYNFLLTCVFVTLSTLDLLSGADVEFNISLLSGPVYITMPVMESATIEYAGVRSIFFFIIVHWTFI